MMENGWDPISKISEKKREKLQVYEELLLQYNRKINLISRQDTEAVQEDHIRHCLSLAYRSFPSGAKVVDWGTGGGLPAVPLAIAMPNVTFFAVDAVAKKVQAVRTFSRRLELKNLFCWHGRAEEWDGAANYSVSRATAPLLDLWNWHSRVAEPLEREPADEYWPQGLICLKGGELTDEIRKCREEYPVISISSISLYKILGDDRFKAKKIISVY